LLVFFLNMPHQWRIFRFMTIKRIFTLQHQDEGCC